MAKFALYKQLHANVSESEFVERLVAIGWVKVKELKEWEPHHQELRKEQGREFSLMKDDKTAEIVRLMNANPSLTVEEVDKELESHGMRLGIVEKIYLYMARKDRLMIGAEHLAARLAEFEEYGHGDDPRAVMAAAAQEIAAIDEKVESLKAEYRRIFPKREIFKLASDQ